MKPKIDGEKASRILIEKGYFTGFDMIMRDYDVSDESAMRVKAGLYKHILIKVLEAKKEIIKLQATVDRMETACRAGMIPKRYFVRTSQTDTFYGLLINALQSFDGWSISLLETNISLLATLRNPETAGIRVNSLQSSFAELYIARSKDIEPYKNFPDLFDLTIVID